MKTTHRWNKTALACGATALALMGLLSRSALAQASPQAIIVLRHGDDVNARIEAPTWPAGKLLPGYWGTIAPTWPTYTGVPTYGTVVAKQHGLSVLGEAQAKFLATAFPAITNAFGLRPITRVVTKNPGGTKDTTPNPFDTIYPFLKIAPTVQLILVDPDGSGKLIDSGLKKMLPSSAGTAPADDLLGGTAGSTVLSWDAEGLWGKDLGEGRRWDDGNILNKLAGPALGAYIKRSDYVIGGGCPKKGARIYVFVPREPKKGSKANEPRKYDCIIIDVINEQRGDNLDYALEIVARLRVDEDTGTMRIAYPEVGERDPWVQRPAPTP